MEEKQTNTEDLRNITREKLLENLIDAVKAIRDKYPYEAFILVTAGLEFVGKCLNVKCKTHKDFFNNAFKYASEGTVWDIYHKITDASVSEKDKFYECVRCGMVHQMMPNPGFVLSSTKESNFESNPKIVNIDDYRSLLDSALKKLKSDTETKDNMNEEILAIGNINGYSMTGHTADVKSFTNN